MSQKVGIVGYGAYVPRYRIRVEEIAKVWGENANTIKSGLMIEEKAVADRDEDTITMAVEAARSAIKRGRIEPSRIGALFVGSESHPYAVKPSGTVVVDAIGTSPKVMVADFEFACKAGTAAMQVCSAFVRAGDIEYGMAIGADTAQGRPGDALEYTAASGAAAFLIGKNPLATIDHMCSFTTDTPDFWRREGKSYPQHGARFTGEPAYFRHVVSATKMLFDATGTGPDDYDYVVLHMPNGKFPTIAAKKLGIDMKKLQQGLVVKKIGNTYSGSSMLGLCSVLDVAEPGQKILMTSFGSGAGSDSFAMTVMEEITSRKKLAPSLEYYVNRKEYVDYGVYVKLRGKLKRS